jgi:LacI family transcriptional regulator, gluconate utilization system Gnt-I transcriptional repressor
LVKESERRAGHGTVTLADVARAANVSEITVSRVVRNKGPVADATRDRVNAAIIETGYIPNLLAGSLASAGSHLIGVVIPSLANIVFPDVLRGLNEAVSKTPYRTVIGVSDYDLEEEGRMIGSLLSWRPAALVVTGLDQSPQSTKQLKATKSRIIQIMDIDAEPIGVAVGMSHFKAGREMARYLISKGYRRFGFVGHDLKHDVRANKRYMSFRSTLAEAGASFVGEALLPAPSGVDLGRRGLQTLLAEHRNIEVVVFSNDDVAIGGFYHCLAAGIDVPGQLGLAGFNGLDIGQQLPRPLTTIKTHRYELGFKAGQIALDLIAGRPVAPMTDVGFELVPGATA